MTLLIVAADGPAMQDQAPALADALRLSGHPVLALLPCHMLVREAVRLAPQAVVAIDDGQADLLQAALALLAGSLPLPVLLLGPARPPADPASWLAARVMAWLPDAPTDAAAAARGVHAALLLALPRFTQEQAQAAALGDALARLDERKWLDRAKGVLMSRLQLKEQDAFALLRSASMTANLRVGEVSRNVIEASQAAETVRDFEATLLALEQAPLASDDIRAALARARAQWQRLLDGLRRAAGPEPQAGQSALARESDALLAGFEQLTTLYEHSPQVLMN